MCNILIVCVIFNNVLDIYIYADIMTNTNYMQNKLSRENFALYCLFFVLSFFIFIPDVNSDLVPGK